MVTKIRKRDGKIEDFNRERIASSIFRAAEAVEGRDRGMAERLSDQVVCILYERFTDGNPPDVEEVQDVIEKVLVENGHYRTAKAYILYRKRHEELRNLRSAAFDTGRMIEDFVSRSDWRSAENANIAFSIPALMFHNTGSITARYMLDRIYPPEISDSHISGDIHLHDLYQGLQPYCMGWSLQRLLLEGFKTPGGVCSSPPKHLDTALLQIVNFIGSAQNEAAGAQALNSVDVLLAPFVHEDGLDYRRTKQLIQQLVYNLNITSRWGGQSPFTNMSFCLTCPEDLANEPAIVSGKPLDRTYGDFKDEVEMLNRAFIEVMMGGDSSGRPFTFPIPTYSITKEFEWEEGVSADLFGLTAKLGFPYFANFVNSSLKPSEVRSMCCRLQLNLAELRRNVTGGLFGSGDATGSVGVVTINMPRLGYLHREESEFFEKLEYLMGLAERSLEHKREVVERNIQGGLLPLTRHYLGSLRNHFSTVGLVGMNECLLNMGFEDGIVSEGGRGFAIQVLKFMREKLIEFQSETGHLYNLEATPAEGTSYRLARIDRRKYPGIVTAGGDVPYYSNSTCLPVDSDLQLWKALEHQEPLQELYTGGTVFHIYLGEAYPSPTGVGVLLKRIAERFRLPYLTLTPTFSCCEDHGYLSGEHERCPTCGKQADVYSRVVGYYRPVRNWNVGKQREFRQRRYFG